MYRPRRFGMADTLTHGAREWRKWLFALLPLVALVEVIAQWVIQARVPSDDHWRAAASFIRSQRREGDLVTSAPLWTDPIARMFFADMIPLRDAARPDATRYRRALVATIRGGENPDLRGWREASSRSFGPVTVRVMENPSPATVRYDLIEHARPGDAEVFRVRGDQRDPCVFRAGFPVVGGGLGQGALAGPERFQCPGDGWNYVGATVIEDMQHRGRLCLWSHPVQGGVMVTRWPRATVGERFHGHHGIAYEAERGDDFGHHGGPVELRVLIDDREVGRDTHRDEDGWRGFEFDTRAFAGGTHAVTVEVRAEDAGMRHYCFEGDLR